MRRLIAACALWLCAALIPAHAADYRSEYRLSTVLPVSYAWGQAGERWAELVREKTGGRIRIRMYPGASLVGGDQTRELTAMRQGVIDLAIGSTINWSSQIKALNLFSLPFLVPNYRALDTLTQGEVGKRLFAILESAGVVPLAWGENGFREVSNSRRPIRSPQDMRGLKLRVVGSPIFIDTFTALGANPTQMSFADAQPALSSGAVDGQENPLSVFITARLHMLGQKYLTLWGYTADPLVFAVNREVWESWTPADREAVRAAALQAAAENVRAARRGIADGSAIKTIEGRGVTVTRLTPEEKQAFAVATRAVYDKWTGKIGRELLEHARAAIAAP